MSYLENRINSLRWKNAATFNCMTETWLNPLEDDEEEQRHDRHCRCHDCEMASAEEYYDAKYEADRD